MLQTRLALAALFLSACAFPALAQPVTAELVADLATSPNLRWSSDSENYRTLDGVAFFTTYDRTHGVEPWATKGNAETRLLGDICPGPCTSSPREFRSDGSELFFLANDGFDSSILYSTDGETLRRYGRHDASGTVLGGNLYFLRHENAGTGEERRVLWRATRETSEIAPFLVLCEGDCEAPTGVLTLGDQLLLTSADALWVLRPGVDSAPRQIADVSGTNFFALPNGRIVFEGPPNGRPPEPNGQFWVTDGTVAGTRPLGGQTGVVNRYHLFAGKLYFTTLANSIYETDGITIGISGDLAMPAGLPYVLLGSTSQAIYYLANGRLFSFAPGAGRQQIFSSGGSFLGALPDGRAILTEDLRTGGPYNLYVSDGSPAGTSLLRSVQQVSGYYQARTANGLLFQAFDPADPGELWYTDGTVAGTGPLDFALPESSLPDFYATAGLLYVGTQSQDLFALRPETGENTQVAGKYRPVGVLPAALLAVDQGSFRTLAFGAQDPEEVENLGMLDADNTSVPANGRLYFANNTIGQKLWESDGSAAGTRELTDPRPDYVRECGPIPEGPCIGRDYPTDITPSGSKIFFEAVLPGFEQVIYAYDLLTHTRLEKISFDETVSYNLELESLGDGRVAILRSWSVRPDSFPYISTENHLELWISDGSVAGTRRITELVHSAEWWGYQSPFLVRSGNRLYFPVPFTDHDELWASDLVTGATEKVAVWPQIGKDRADWLAMNGRIYFPAATAAAGFELWRSDGTPAGTRQMVDLFPGTASSMPSQPFALGDGRFVFAAGEAVHGHELWISDGGIGGAQLLADIDPGLRSGSPSDFVRIGSHLYFEAEHVEVGREVFRVALPPPCTTQKLCLRGGRFEATVQVKTPSGQVVQASRVFAAEAAGMFTFFNESNWEMMVKVLDGCELNNHFWVFAAAATDLEHTLTVKDLEAGIERSWTSPAGPAKAITDSSAFATCGAPGG